MQRNGLRDGFLQIFVHGAVAGVERVRFRRERQIHRRLRQRQVALGRPDEIERLLGGERHRQRAGLGQADIFAGHAHHAPREVERVFARFEHARQPIERRVGIGIAHRFVQRGNEVEMLLAGSCRRAAAFSAARLRGAPRRARAGRPAPGSVPSTSASSVL